MLEPEELLTKSWIWLLVFIVSKDNQKSLSNLRHMVKLPKCHKNHNWNHDVILCLCWELKDLANCFKNLLNSEM